MGYIIFRGNQKMNLKNNELVKPGAYILTRTDDDDNAGVLTRVYEKFGEFYCEGDDVNPISSYDSQCRWQFYFV